MKNNEKFCSQCGHSLTDEKPDFVDTVADQVMAMLASDDDEKKEVKKDKKPAT